MTNGNTTPRSRSKNYPARRRFDPFEADILRYLRFIGRARNTSQIAEATKMSWETARDHLENLFGRGYVLKGERPNQILWKYRWI